MYSGQKLAVKNAVNLSKIIFWTLDSFMEIYNMSCNIQAKHWMDTLKSLDGVDFTKYALLSIIQYVQWSKIG